VFLLSDSNSRPDEWAAAVICGRDKIINTARKNQGRFFANIGKQSHSHVTIPRFPEEESKNLRRKQQRVVVWMAKRNNEKPLKIPIPFDEALKAFLQTPLSGRSLRRRLFGRRRNGLSAEGGGSTLRFMVDFSTLQSFADAGNDHKAAALTGGLNSPVVIDEHAVKGIQYAVHRTPQLALVEFEYKITP
jgi:hypothetical protein